MKYSVVIPLYNEQETIKTLYYRLKEVMDGLGSSYEIVLVNDGSTDDTLSILARLDNEKNNLIIVNLPQNRGQSAAYQEGFDITRGDIIITMDGDFQNDPKDIPKLLDKLNQGYDVVCGWRKKRTDNFIIKLLSRIGNISRRMLLKERIHDVGCALRVYRKESLQDINLRGMYHMLTAILASYGYRIEEVEVNHYRRKFGMAKFSIMPRIFSSFLIFRYLSNKNYYTNGHIK